MKYQVLYDNPNEDILTRLLKVRNVEDNIEDFLNPTFSKYWIDPFLLNDMEKAVDRILLALKKNERIVILGDYDVD
jgi:single-stranded-DNA-specific exonuclease